MKGAIDSSSEESNLVEKYHRLNSNRFAWQRKARELDQRIGAETAKIQQLQLVMTMHVKAVVNMQWTQSVLTKTKRQRDEAVEQVALLQAENARLREELAQPERRNKRARLEARRIEKRFQRQETAVRTAQTIASLQGRLTAAQSLLDSAAAAAGLRAASALQFSHRE